MSRRVPWDQGLQLERTGLAWLRTGLAFAVGSAGLVRLTAYRNTTLAAALAVAVTPLVLALLWLAWRRFRRGERRLHADQALPDGRLPAVISALGVVLGVAGLTYVLVT